MPSAEFVRVLRHWNAVGAARLDDALTATSARPRMSVVSSPGVDVERVLGVIDAVAPADARPGEPAVVLLVVLDASTPIGRAAISTLRQVPSSVRVVIAIENTERFDDWSAVRDRDRELIAEYAPALAAVEIRAIPSESAELILDVADAARGTDRQWAARTAHRELDQAVDGARRAIAAAGRRPSVAADMDAARSERAAAVAGRDGDRSERMMSIRGRTTLLRVGLVHEVGDEVRQLSHGVTTSTHRRHGDFARSFESDIDSAATRLDARLRASLSELGVRPDRTVDTHARIPTPPRRARGAEELLAGLLGASAGAGLGRLIAALTSASAGVTAAAMIVAALLIGTLTMLARSRAADRAHLHRWTGDVLGERRSNWEQRVIEAVLRAESDLTDDVTAAARRDRAAADAEIARLDDRIRTLSMSNNGRGAGLERDLAALERGADSVHAEIAEPITEPARPTV